MRDAQPVGHLFLRMFTPAPQPEAQLHDFPVARRQAGHGAQQKPALRFLLHPHVHGILIAAQHIGEQQLVAVPIHVEGIVDGNLVAQLGMLAQKHEDLIFDAARSIGGQLDVALRAECVHSLDEADGADGDEILHARVARFIFPGYVDDKPQIVCDERLACILLPRADTLHDAGLLLRCEGRRKGFGTVDVMHGAAQTEFLQKPHGQTPGRLRPI